MFGTANFFWAAKWFWANQASSFSWSHVLSGSPQLYLLHPWREPSPTYTAQSFALTVFPFPSLYIADNFRSPAFLQVYHLQSRCNTLTLPVCFCRHATNSKPTAQEPTLFITTDNGIRSLRSQSHCLRLPIPLGSHSQVLSILWILYNLEITSPIYEHT